ncbi:MAG: Rieske 2Fe-2S domain-containing protein [Mariprofundaceae bacterium]|nr:Rieske 2Fe-2S domain-containing protein [Mariprofundaceae bacterium]
MTWQTVVKPEEGKVTCFLIMDDSLEKNAFVICFQGQFYAYENRCPHMGTTLDWVEGQFFSEQWLMCQTHGALFNPINGDCVSGPCSHGLRRLKLRDEQDHLLIHA